ncbi:Hypothetical protein PP7435_CHR4-1081 [Komagataella phaffii CBS 7435]|uniref:Uncharacterized protein n=1 Tax=Komagataella phaffii (strain ATCC 76273 / CBS 7435 / CECT 11047 / NRRL Y-11430 / Wegner 21-1) TaxID=981350 RepID=A0A1G4KQN3_KOMPC|nr:Hypothetical protein BQ9382_C4-0362 [Komagataella phaffii CBS 7435]SCV12322.1 Hypothetical protein PP7435_CHR4-1081 [Komagataella phaffii CBS 7435]
MALSIHSSLSISIDIDTELVRFLACERFFTKVVDEVGVYSNNNLLFKKGFCKLDEYVNIGGYKLYLLRLAKSFPKQKQCWG